LQIKTVFTRVRLGCTPILQGTGDLRGPSTAICGAEAGSSAIIEARPMGSVYALHWICQTGYIPDVATSFQVLADPVRRRILDLLLERPRPVGELVEQLGLTQPGTSKHLRVLREAGLVQVRQDAQRRWYELRPDPLTEIDAWLQPYRRLWAASLDALERHLDAMPDNLDAIPDNLDTMPGNTEGTPS
jgi:DNA-binding transcriptional ArsR family regulator